MTESGGDNPRYYFESKIRLKCYNDRYISASEEAELVAFAIHNLTPPMSADEARGFIGDWALEHDVVIENAAFAQGQHLLRRALRDDGRVDQQEFEAVVEAVRAGTRGRLADPVIRGRLKRMMLDHGWRARGEGLFGPRWFHDIPAEET